MSEQLSNFNSIVGVVLGIQLAHHYPGHYTKYAAKLDRSARRQIPINRRLTPVKGETH